MKENQQIPIKIPVSGSLGLLALGHRGVIAWRKVRDAHQQNKTDSKEADTK